jgi:lipid-binding SYLF domain-containing protein
MRNYAAALSALILLVVISGAALAGQQEEADQGKDPKEAKRDYKRAKIDQNERETLARLFEEDAKAKRLFDQAAGYAVFDNTKISLGLTGGGGTGVAVDKESGQRTYMKMGTAGLNLGLGAQVYQIVFLFQDAETLHNFIEKGWEADASANAVAGTAGANAEATFRKGMAIYPLTQGGLMLQADISGTKYWKYEKLNR